MNYWERMRERLAGTDGPVYWRTLDELAATDEFQAAVERDFPQYGLTWHDPVSRRQFLKFIGASAAFASLAACRQPLERILPYSEQPEKLIPGKPLFFASVLPHSGFGRGVLVESHMGRPTKVEGNPKHPSSLGSSDAWMQASVLGLYDPDRSKAVVSGGRIRTWDEFRAALMARLAGQRPLRGRGLRILTGAVTSPSVSGLLEELARVFPDSRWHVHEPAGRGAAVAGAKLAFGVDADVHYELEKAGAIVSLDADFLHGDAGSVRYGRDFAARRKPDREMARLYAVEPVPSVTGSNADHRLPLPASRIPAFAALLASELGLGADPRPSTGSGRTDGLAERAAAMARDLKARRGGGLVVPGLTQPPQVHALAHAMNEKLGSEAEVLTAPIERRGAGTLEELGRDIDARDVDILLMLGVNPVYSASAGLEFEARLKRVRFSAHLGAYFDETARASTWHIPEAHPLESWGDLRGHDGTASIQQPLIAPLYSGRTVLELLAAALGRPGQSPFDLVRAQWRLPERKWREALHEGLVPGSQAGRKPLKFSGPFALSLSKGEVPWASAESARTALEVNIRPDPAVWDGAWANNGWLQELPRPVSTVAWGNVLSVSPGTAERLGLANEQEAELQAGGGKVRGPVWVQPGQADGAVVVTLGGGRREGGTVARGVGFDAYRLQTVNAAWLLESAALKATGRRSRIASTQAHHAMAERAPVRAAPLVEFLKKPGFAAEGRPGEAFTLFPPHEPGEYAWAMSIDLNACIGCNACMVACQAENNIPVVGREEVLNSRELHWIRIDRYYEGAPESPELHHQPVPCMHCETAPCELVCPVAATTHSAEGLNEMTYNRCVGTRYCSNNCPYKVRRFNFLQYSDVETESLRLMQNPDVTVRARGVMEKCTYCVQRINHARIDAKREGRRIADGEVVPACAQACPGRAIVFGDLTDAASAASLARKQPRNYSLLAELGTRPRTTYLAKVTNPNSEWPA